MTYTRRNIAEEQEEAHRLAQNITVLCEEFHIALDPIDWQNAGMRAPVTVNAIRVADLLDFSRQDNASILRQMQMKLFEQAALNTVHAQSTIKASMWSPVEVVQPQKFLCLWVITLETDERVAIAEYIRNGQRAYEPFTLNVSDEKALADLFGAANSGEYELGDSVTIAEYERKYTGKIVYVLPPGKTRASEKYSSRGRHIISGKVYTNGTSSKYVVDCHDGFPHVVNQWQIVNEPAEK